MADKTNFLSLRWVTKSLAASLMLLYSLLLYSHDSSLEYINKYVPNAVKVGGGELKIFIWHMYDVGLYAPKGKWSPELPHALWFEYKRAFSSEELVVSIVNQMRKYQNVDELRLAAWYNTLRDFVPDVAKGDFLSIIANDAGETVFIYHSIETEDYDIESGRVSDPSFSKYFFNIWLGENVEHPDLRLELLNI